MSLMFVDESTVFFHVVIISRVLSCCISVRVDVIICVRWIFLMFMSGFSWFTVVIIAFSNEFLTSMIAFSYSERSNTKFI